MALEMVDGIVGDVDLTVRAENLDGAEVLVLDLFDRNHGDGVGIYLTQVQARRLGRVLSEFGTFGNAPWYSFDDAVQMADERFHTD